MKKYRIKVITLGSGTKQYEPQCRFLFFFWVRASRGSYRTIEAAMAIINSLKSWDNRKINYLKLEE